MQLAVFLFVPLDATTRVSPNSTFNNMGIESPNLTFAVGSGAFVPADKTYVVSADTTSVVSANKTSVMSLLQQTSPKTSPRHSPHMGGRFAAAPVWGMLGGMSWEMSADTMTQQMSCLQTHFLPKIHHLGFARFITSKMESCHHFHISGDLPAICIGVIKAY